MIKVLFVCLGNICRSPMAEAFFRDLVKREGLEDQFIIDSGGMGSWHTGKPPHEGTRNILKERNISYQGMKARQVSLEDFDQFDYIVAMDDHNINDLKSLKDAPEGVEIMKLMEVVENSSEENVPDPYYTGDFNQTAMLVDQGCKALLEKIKKEKQLVKSRM
ncbi:protein-tyrosine phosphatase [Natronobacillus azotifigens]|uniref:protein-tyrosine-phosphatase n=1 Tax=Natronobacillus azotifigens TaxID=472978 RepID=A0A9J6RAY4_9BACI|nr:low molecular weight protein-tyrosine-phosphatase [Natronobacillus azotifigens]MCZ0702824.1 low molecular weight phosphotyrosine protein phosphatase [Natronobacillus azotifigens]